MNKKKEIKPFLEAKKSEEQGLSFERLNIKRKAFTNYWHYHPELELNFAKSGNGIRYVGDHIGPFQGGEMVFIGSNLPHDHVSLPKDEDDMNEIFVIKFRPDLFLPFDECQNFIKLYNLAKKGLLFSIDAKLEAKIMGVFHANKITALSNLMKLLEALLDESFVTLSKVEYRLTENSNELNMRLNKAINYIHEKHKDPITLEEIAEFCNMEPHAFSRWFKKYSGSNYLYYLNKVRVSYACQWLSTVDLSISQIAFNCGFTNMSTFERVFKKYVGKSPTQYRKEFQELLVEDS